MSALYTNILYYAHFPLTAAHRTVIGLTTWTENVGYKQSIENVFSSLDPFHNSHTKTMTGCVIVYTDQECIENLKVKLK
jgi:hypothetical protein